MIPSPLPLTLQVSPMDPITEGSGTVGSDVVSSENPQIQKQRASGSESESESDPKVPEDKSAAA
jgi:hypothetical protein